MKFIKFGIILVAVLALTVPAWSGNIPEYDAVEDDSDNVFALFNLIQYGQVAARNIGAFGPINDDSDFTEKFIDSRATPPDVPFQLELYKKLLGPGVQLVPDPCFDEFVRNFSDFQRGYFSSLTPAFTESSAEWRIVLQMQPETDINLNIYDCVLKHNTFDLWTAAEQTGRYRANWGQLFFNPAQNPRVTVRAWPGEQAAPGFDAPFVMDGRSLPGLFPVVMENQLYTSKGLWAEGLVLTLPKNGEESNDGDAGYQLNAGDIIQVRIDIPRNPTDMWYGEDNVILKYVGVIGTEYYARFVESIDID